MTKQLTNWYENLLNDCSAIVTETLFASKWALIEGYFELGKRVREEGENATTPIVERLAQDLGMSERNVWYAISAFDKFGSPEKLPFGKSASWNKVKKLLSGKPTEDKCEHKSKRKVEWEICDDCDKILK